MKIDEALYQLKQNIKMHEIEGTTSNQNEREKALLDYITNLQDTLKDREEYCYGLETQITNLQEEKNMFKGSSETMSKNYFEEKSRNEKALDKLYCYGEVFDSKILQEFQKEMENILNGGD